MKIKEKTEAIKKNTSSALSFMTAKSKKITISLLFLISVIADQAFFDNILFPPDKLLQSNVFVALAITIAVILTKDVQSIVQLWVDKKLKGK